MADATVKQQTQDVCYPGKGGPLNAYLATPEGSGPFPVVIVVQEWWGLNEHIKDIARRLAGEGYFAVAPDLYSRQGHRVTDDPNVAAELMEGLKPNEGIDDLFGTIGWIKKQSAAKATHIGIVGFCLGGSYAALLPCCTRDLKAAAPFYGEIPDDDKLHQLSCPLLYVYGSNDGWIQRADADRLAKRCVPSTSRAKCAYTRAAHTAFSTIAAPTSIMRPTHRMRGHARLRCSRKTSSTDPANGSLRRQ
jgi:carboxymethylenebutenolidase